MKPFTTCWEARRKHLFLGLSHTWAEPLQGSQSLREAPRDQLLLKKRFCFSITDTFSMAYSTLKHCSPTQHHTYIQ